VRLDRPRIRRAQARLSRDRREGEARGVLCPINKRASCVQKGRRSAALPLSSRGSALIRINTAQAAGTPIKARIQLTDAGDRDE
jgi:hypothetical protein